jgi:hypothetical protein
MALPLSGLTALQISQEMRGGSCDSEFWLEVTEASKLTRPHLLD